MCNTRTQVTHRTSRLWEDVSVYELVSNSLSLRDVWFSPPAQDHLWCRISAHVFLVDLLMAASYRSCRSNTSEFKKFGLVNRVMVDRTQTHLVLLQFLSLLLLQQGPASLCLQPLLLQLPPALLQLALPQPTGLLLLLQPLGLLRCCRALQNRNSLRAFLFHLFHNIID